MEEGKNGGGSECNPPDLAAIEPSVKQFLLNIFL
jgi:hypothetical protein